MPRETWKRRPMDKAGAPSETIASDLSTLTSTFVVSSDTFTGSRRAILLRAEISFREAGRALELSVDPELQRVGKVSFRLASRCRTDRLAVAA